MQPSRTKKRNAFLLWAAVLFASLAISVTAVRTYRDYAPLSRQFSFSKMGLFDFHNGGRQPAMAFRDGVNPYSEEACEPYTMTRSAPAYSPVVFIQHLPFTFIDLKTADVLYWIFNLGLIGLLAYWAITMSRTDFGWTAWLAILGLFVLSRPGHISLYTGYFTAQLVVGTVITLHYGKTKPWLSGLGMVLASGKPTYILPLIVVMIARKNYRATMIGVSLCAIAAAVGLGWLASFSSLEQVIEGVKSGQAAFQEDVNEDPENTWTRLDTVGVVCKVAHWKPGNLTYLSWMFVLLVIPCVAIHRVANNENNVGMTGLSALIASLAILISIYHHSYDCLLLTIPWIAVTFFGKSTLPELSRNERFVMSFLLGIPAANYLSTFKVRDFLGVENDAVAWNIITSINGVCLFAALVIAIVAAFRFQSARGSEAATVG